MRQKDIAGAFLRIGTVTNPEKDYHLEFVCETQEEAAELIDKLAAFDISAAVQKRKDKYVVYINKSDTIMKLLILLGAQNAVLQYENARFIKEIKSDVQRRVNFETANIRKTVDASLRQLEDIKLIRSAGRFDELSEKAAAAARLREEYPDASLSELAAEAGEGRSAMNHRFRRIAELAGEIRSGTLL